MDKEKVIDEVIEYLDSLSESDLITIHNSYCDDTYNVDGYIYYMCELDDLFQGCKPSEIIDRIRSNFYTSHNYFYFDGYGHARSTDYPTDKIYTSDIAEQIVLSGNFYNDSNIREILENSEEESEE